MEVSRIRLNPEQAVLSCCGCPATGLRGNFTNPHQGTLTAITRCTTRLEWNWYTDPPTVSYSICTIWGRNGTNTTSIITAYNNGACSGVFS